MIWILLLCVILGMYALLAASDDPHFFYRKDINAGYLTRWHIIPRNPWFNIYLHRFTGNDDARALHDHPWDSLSIRIWGRIREAYRVCDSFKWWGNEIVRTRHRIPPIFCFRKAEFAHRLEMVGTKPCWTIFITGPVKRDWGFWDKGDWLHWTRLTTSEGKAVDHRPKRAETPASCPTFWLQYPVAFYVNESPVDRALEVLPGHSGYVEFFTGIVNIQKTNVIRGVRHGRVRVIPGGIPNQALPYPRG